MSDQATVHCTDHPETALVRAYVIQAPANVQADQRACPDARHREWGRLRCAFCGGPIRTRRAWAAVYCSTRHRVAALRARRRMAGPTAAPAGGPQPGLNAGPMSGPGATVQEGPK